jgi:hypothetical protein
MPMVDYGDDEQRKAHLASTKKRGIHDGLNIAGTP